VSGGTQKKKGEAGFTNTAWGRGRREAHGGAFPPLKKGKRWLYILTWAVPKEGGTLVNRERLPGDNVVKKRGGSRRVKELTSWGNLLRRRREGEKRKSKSLVYRQ